MRSVAPLALCLFLALCLYTTTAVKIKINDPNANKAGIERAPYFVRQDYSDLAKEILAIMNQTVDPCVDFYEYSCGTWLNTFPLPSDASRFGMSFDAIAKANQEVLRSILEDPSGEWPIIGPFYKSCMNTDLRNKLGATPLLPLLEQLKQVSLFFAPVLFPLIFKAYLPSVFASMLRLPLLAIC